MDRSRIKQLRMLFLVSLSILAPFKGESQNLGVKTNALWWATTTPNVGVETALSQKVTLDLSGSYNPWSFWKGGATLRHWLVQPEVRYWPCKSFEGHFVGVHANYGRYNIGQIPFLPELDTYVYRGYLVGAGVSYGYHWALGRRWGLEVNAGLGYTYLEYDKYVCAECAERMGRYKRSFFGPSRLGVSIIYFIH